MTEAQQNALDRISIREEILQTWTKLFKDHVILMLPNDWATIEPDGTTHWSSLSRQAVLSS